MEEQNTVIYDIKQGNEQRKAMDLIALKKYLNAKRAEHSLLTLDVDEVKDVYKEIAKGAIDTIAELEDAVNKALGLEQEIEPEEEVDVEPEIEPAVEQAPPPPPPPPPPQPAQPKPVQAQPAQPKEEFDDQAEQDGQIVL